MLKGIHLSLRIGPALPQPVPVEVVEALNKLEVSVSSTGASGFQMSFELSNQSPLQSRFIEAVATFAPLMRVIVTVTLNAQPHVLIDGVMTNHQAAGSRSGYTNVSITGSDLTAVMDLQELSGFKYFGLSPAGRVALVLSKYSALGVIPKVIPSPFEDLRNPTDGVPAHEGTDLAYVKKLADDVGHIFYHEPGPRPGVSFAYWGPEIKVGRPQPPLTTNMDEHTNTDDISFSFESHAKKLPVALIQEPTTKLPIPIPVPDIGPLNPPLGPLPITPHSITLLRDTAKLKSVGAIAKLLGEASKSANVVTASGSLDVMKYGRILQARRLVSVRGAGRTLDGHYFVESVKHNISRGEYKQSFTLNRNALRSFSERVAL